MKSKFNPAISILIHECPSFFEIQCLNIRHYYPNATIVVHVNEVLWNTQKRKIVRICLKYSVIINPDHLSTKWATPSLFDAIRFNMNILNELSDWTHYIFMSSNELFVSDLLEEKCIQSELAEKLPVVWDSYCGITPLEENTRDREAVLFDKALIQFSIDKGVVIRTGLDFGRVVSRVAFKKLFKLLNEYWRDQKMPPISYSQSEVVLPTLIEYLGTIKEITIIRDLYVSTWITNYQYGAKQDFIIVKKVPRDKHDPLVKKIMESIEVNYSTTIFDYFKSSLRKNAYFLRVFYKEEQIRSDFIKFLSWKKIIQSL